MQHTRIKTPTGRSHKHDREFELWKTEKQIQLVVIVKTILDR